MMEEINVSKLPIMSVSEEEVEGKKICYITFEEAIKEILRTIREIKKEVS